MITSIKDSIQLRMDLNKYLKEHGSHNTEKILKAFYFNPKLWAEMEDNARWGGDFNLYIDEIERFINYRKVLHNNETEKVDKNLEEELEK